ncbi:MAG: metallophosphoesterase [Stomatobaculum sp.]|nr:metallophosphoesterase [Stomatobaculum sp.]
MRTATTAVPAKPARKKRGFWRVLLHILAVLLILAVISGAAVYIYREYMKTHYKVTFYQEASRKVSGNIRLAVISDIHNREYGKNNDTLLADLRALEPDLILFLGDMVIRQEDDYQAVLNLVSASSQIAPCYGVLGNHESERIYYQDDKDLTARFKSAGLKLLRNASETIQIGSDTVQLIGIEGTAYGFEEYGGRAFMEKTALDPSAYSIVMAHIPVLFKSQLSDYAFDLGLAGHVHGGIVRLPFLGGLYSGEEGFFPEYTLGKYTLCRGQSLIISGGLGDSNPYRPRINNMPELVVIDISRY